MKMLLRYLLVLALFGGSSYSVRAQDAEGSGGNSAGISKKQFEKQEAKKSRKDKKELIKKEKRDYKVHLKHQDKATRKRMKRNKREAGNRGQAGQRPGFFRKLFTKH